MTNASKHFIGMTVPVLAALVLATAAVPRNLAAQAAPEQPSETPAAGPKAPATEQPTPPAQPDGSPTAAPTEANAPSAPESTAAEPVDKPTAAANQAEAVGVRAQPGERGEPGESTEAEGSAAEVRGDKVEEERHGEEEIIITGSRVKSSVFAASAPVEIMKREQIEQSGATNLADLVKDLTLAQGSGFQGATEASNRGTASINLRGLGRGSTLVLINGRRVAPSGGGVAYNYVDIATIPMSAVERIEVLKGGASAIYGSDAVAGVINIITRQNWEGLRIEGDAQSTDRFDQSDYTASVSLGATGERSRLTASLQYLLRSELMSNQRDWTLRGDPISSQGYPGTYLVGGTPTPDPDCSLGPNSEPRDGFCTFNFNDFYSLIDNLERASGYAYGEYDFTHHTRAFLELGLSRTRSDNANAPSYPVPPPFPVVPADHIDNPFGREVEYIGRPLGAEAGLARNSADDDTLRSALGLKGDFEDIAFDTLAEDWEWELFVTFGISRVRFQFHDTLRSELQAALNSCSDPSDMSNCFNPFYTAFTGEGTPNSAAVISRISGLENVVTDHALQTYNAGITGSLFELPGGDLGFALGGEIRREWRSTDLDDNANQLRYSFLLGNSDARAERHVYGAYAELLWPLYHGIEVQTAGRIERYSDTDALSGSPTVGLTVRPADIAGRDNVVSALRRLQLRGHLSRAFRAPTVYQAFPSLSVRPQLFALPELPLPLFLPVQLWGNPDLDPETATALSGGMQWQPDDWLVLSTDYWQYDYQNRIDLPNARQVLTEWLDGGGDASGVVTADGCGARSANCIAAIVTRFENQGDVFTNGIDFAVMFELSGETLGTGRADDFGTITLGGQGTYTISFTVPRDIVVDLVDEDGVALLDDDGNPLPRSGCDGDECDVVGYRNVDITAAPALPRLRLNLPLTWTMSGHMASLIGHYIGSYKDDVYAKADGTFPTVDPMVTFDLQYGYTLDDTVGRATTVRVGLYNIFDSKPPFARNSLLFIDSFDPTVHDPRGRMLYAKLIQEF